jgi:ubiquinone/menaquinone biosynthesis C-methylase UbiE
MTDIPDTSSGTQHYEGYVMDAENAAEMARLMLQDRLLNQAMGGLLAERNDLTHIYRVLDIACGPGGWLLDLTTQYPHMQGVGIDISQLMIDYANNLARTQKLSNVQFRVMDATNPLEFPDRSFDLINGRILTGFLATHQWPTLLQECFRITKPGGILRLTEGEWAFTNSAALDKLASFTTRGIYQGGHSFSPHGRNIGTANMLRLLIKNAGYEDIACKAHVVDFSAGTELHEGNTQNMLVIYKQLQPFFIQMQLASQEELDDLHAQMETDLQADDFCGLDFFLTVWGRKSRSSS